MHREYLGGNTLGSSCLRTSWPPHNSENSIQSPKITETKSFGTFIKLLHINLPFTSCKNDYFTYKILYICYPFDLCYSECRFSTDRIKQGDLMFNVYYLQNEMLSLQKYKRTSKSLLFGRFCYLQFRSHCRWARKFFLPA